jgi:hypothetical protein
MKKIMVAIFDKQAANYGNPFFCNREGQAIRGFQLALQNPETDIGKFPTDFHLEKLGEFDDATGVITQEKPTILITGVDALRSYELEMKAAKTKPEEETKL